MFPEFCAARRRLVSGSKLRAMKHHIGDFGFTDGNGNYPDEFTTTLVYAQKKISMGIT